VPVARYGGYQVKSSDGSVIDTTAIDVVDSGDPPQAYLLDVGQACADVLNSSGMKLHMKIARLSAGTR
jgi:hypothetical protein